MRISYDRSAAHSGQWQDVELIFQQPTQHGSRQERTEGVAYVSLKPAETFMRACLRPMEVTCFRVLKCENNHQLSVASIQRFLRYAYTARFRVIHTRKTLCALRTRTQTLIGVFFVHRNGDTHGCLTQGRNQFYFDELRL